MNVSNNAPHYQQVADTLRRRIHRGEYRKGEVIPTASQLEELFSVSNITIRKALAILAEEGWVRGQRGVGTVVVSAPETQRVNIAVSGNFTDWVDTASGKNLPLEQEVLSFGEERGPADVCRKLGVRGQKLWVMRRIRRISGNIISHHVNFGLPETLGAITDENMSGTRNFVDVLREDCGCKLIRMDQTVEASLADRDLSALLHVDFGTPIFFVENTYFERGDKVVAVSHLFLRGDHYAYQTSISLNETETKTRKSHEPGLSKAGTTA
jgi:GntR family transcriptional regulator